MLPGDCKELENWRLYRGLIECGVKTFWAIRELKQSHIFWLDSAEELPLAAETYPLIVAERLGIRKLPSKRKEPLCYVDQVCGFLQSVGYRCESIVRPCVDHVDSMLCAVTAQALIGGSGSFEVLGEKPQVDEAESVLREGYIIYPVWQFIAEQRTAGTTRVS